MEVQALIDSYADDVAARLPRTIRSDVALELRSLLTDQLNDAAVEAGRAPDSELAMRVLSRFGRPEDVAVRYRPRGFDIIEPELAPAFVKTTVACVVLQWVLTLPYVFSSTLTFGEWALRWGFGALWLVGLLVLWFGAAAWIRRRSPVDPHSFSRPWTHYIFWLPLPADWRPDKRPRVSVDPDEAAKRGAPVLLPLAALVTIVFAASWTLYDEAFLRGLFLPLIALMILRVSLYAAVIIESSWWARTRVIRLALWIGFVGLLWTASGGQIFAAPHVDFIFKAWLLIFLIVNTVQIALWCYRALARYRLRAS
jgi:hypothetical protein